MQRLITTIIGATLMATSVQAELLANRSFEAGDFTGWSQFGPGWRTSGGADARTGDFGAVLDVQTNDVDNYRGLFQNVPVIAGETYSVSVSIRAQNVESSESWLELQWLDTSGTVLGQQQTAHVAADQAFTPSTLSALLAPAGAVTASVRGIVHMFSAPVTNTNFHIFDDFTFVQHPPDLVSNRSFETGDFSGWSAFGQGWYIGTGADAHSGADGAANAVSASESDNYRGLSQNVPVTAGKTYTGSVHIRAVNVRSSESWFEVQWLDTNGGLITQTQSVHVVADQSFTPVQLTDLIAPAGAVTASVRGIIYMSAPPASDADYHVFDDFSFIAQPDLMLTYTGSQFHLDWDENATGFALESAADFPAPDWKPVLITPTNSAGRWWVSLTTNLPSLAEYRLYLP